MIKLIVGLGNPGSQYEQTRHNAGFVFLDQLANSRGSCWSMSAQFHGQVADCTVGNSKVLLLKPVTFMNKSGLSVGSMMRYFKLKPDELLVVHDELDLPEGVIKMKRDGGHAGHNGLRDIIAHIDSRDFYRLRIGIGRPAVGSNVAGYVLSNLPKSAVADLGLAFNQLLDGLDLLLQGDVAKLNAALLAG